MNPTPSDGLFCLCPQCGIPVPAGEYQCRCGCRLSPALPLYRLCPSCMRFIPQAQFKCSCGHTFSVQEQLLHTCPACGAVSPYEQRRCDCGYDFPSPPVYREEDMDKLLGDLATAEQERSALQRRLQRVQTQNAQQWSDFFECAQLTNPYDGTKIKTLADFERYMATHMRELAALKAQTPAEDAPSIPDGAAESSEDAPTVSARAPDFWDSDSFSPPEKPIGYIPVRQPQDDRPVLFDQRKKRALPLWWIVCACLLCIILFGYMLHNAFSTDSNPVKTPENGEILNAVLAVNYCAPLTIDASSCSESTNFYIKLKRIGTNTTYLSFFVRGGMIAEIDAPLGTYEIFYASGTNWYGSEKLFGRATTYYRVGKRLTFDESYGFVNGWTITLGVVPDGNLEVREITAREF